MRIDDFLSKQEHKIKEIFTIAKEKQCKAIVFPGDVFDRADAPYGLVEQTIRWFANESFHYLFVFGQHDLRYHTSDKQNTPLGVLCTALKSQAHILTSKNPFRLGTAQTNAVFYGCSWGETLPDRMEQADRRIIVMHRPVSATPLPWNHPDFILTKDLVKKCPADIFITGDNHTRFISKHDQKTVINMGSVMRTNIAQMKHEPAVAVISLQDMSIDIIQLQIERNVFDIMQIEARQDREERINDFINSLQGSFDPELRFLDNLRAATKHSPAAVQHIISEVLSHT